MELTDPGCDGGGAVLKSCEGPSLTGVGGIEDAEAAIGDGFDLIAESYSRGAGASDHQVGVVGAEDHAAERYAFEVNGRATGAADGRADQVPCRAAICGAQQAERVIGIDRKVRFAGAENDEIGVTWLDAYGSHG